MMSADTKANLPFDERNQQDFMLVTKRIQDALELMANDRRVKRTETNLARLAGCSRGTLRNRQWPMEQLQKLKDEARAAKEQVEIEPRATREKAQVERYREQLMLSVNICLMKSLMVLILSSVAIFYRLAFAKVLVGSDLQSTL